MPSRGPQANWQEKANTGLAFKRPASVTFPHGSPEAGATGQAQAGTQTRRQGQGDQTSQLPGLADFARLAGLTFAQTGKVWIHQD